MGETCKIGKYLSKNNKAAFLEALVLADFFIISQFLNNLAKL